MKIDRREAQFFIYSALHDFAKYLEQKGDGFPACCVDHFARSRNQPLFGNAPAVSTWTDQLEVGTLTAEPWSGKGLPPIGSLCKYGLHEEKIMILAHIEQGAGDPDTLAVGQEVGRKNTLIAAKADQWKPFRTPEEQIVADERKNACIEMSNRAWASLGKIDCVPPTTSQVLAIAEALYDANYRKQEASS